MSGIREEFYSALRREFSEDDFTHSFLYRYLAKEKDDILRDRPNASKRDGPYVLLKTSFMDMERGRIRQEDCLKTVLRVLMKNSKLHIDKRSRDILWAYGRRLCGSGSLDSMRQDKQRYEDLLRVLDRETPAERLSCEEWAYVREDLLKHALEIDAKAFLYDAGFPVSSPRGTIAPRKKDRLLDMLDAYCKENQLSLQRKALTGPAARTSVPPDSQEVRRAQKKRFETFYKELKRSKNTGVLLPIQTDPYSGAGLYIIGKKYYRDNPSIYHRIKGSCCYTFFFLDDVITEDGEVSLVYRMDEEVQDYPNLDEALCWYAEKCRENSLRYFRAVNGPASVSCPEEFRTYFQRGQTQDRWNTGELPVSQEEIEREAAVFGEPPRRKAGERRFSEP